MYRPSVEETQPPEGTPDPTETVRLLKSDFDALQLAVNLAYDDVKALAEILHYDMARALMENPGITPHDVFADVLLPKVAQLMVTQGFVDGAKADITKAAARFGNKTIEHSGARGLKVGQKIPGLFEQSRRDRRAAEREAKRRGR